jgi:hypothetical protein
MSSNTTHPMIKSSPVTQYLMKGMGVLVFETISMNPNIASLVNRESMPGIHNTQVRNGGLVSTSK